MPHLPILSLLVVLAASGSGLAQGTASAPAGVSSEAAPAQPAAGDVIAALKLGEVLEIMRDEGLDYGKTLEADLFPDRGGEGWRHRVDRIYGLDRMQVRLFPVLERELASVPVSSLVQARDFFRSDLGQRIVALENSARRAQLDEEVKTSSRETAARMDADDPARAARLRRLIAVNDLIESNVVGALNANAAFYFGLNEAGAFSERLSQAEVLGDVAGQEEDIREETRDWIDAYVALAYSPLSDADLDSYIRFSDTAAGQALNRAMFAAYDGLFVAISRELGRDAARFIGGQDL